jgi:hypothetical protein
MKTLLAYLAAIAAIVGIGGFWWLASPGMSKDEYASGENGTLFFLTWAAAFLGGGYLVLLGLASIMRAGLPAETARSRAQTIAGYGPQMAFLRTGGRLGDLRASSPLIAVSVHPGGIVVKSLFFPPGTILASEIRAVTTEEGFFGGRRLKIEHLGVGSPSPLVIRADPQSALASAIRSLAPAYPAGAIPPTGGQGWRRFWPFGPLWPSSQPYQAMLDAYPRGVVVLMALAGIVIGATTLVYGITRDIPKLGLFGVVWTAIGALAFAAGLREIVRYFRR